MMLTSTVTKKVLEKLINESFYRLGELTSSTLLDSLKLLGFSHATSAGISITIEDLKTPNTKNEILEETEFFINHVNEFWQKGELSDTERFQSIIDSWNLATESLKNRIVDYYQDFDPVNTLFLMAFSGARGNMSQVRQLIGMRGLMSDQEGKIIDLPIQTNFREGLTSIDYLISSYGARKGIVDTALKTADSGYLTRRLIYVAQELIIREMDCQSKEGILIYPSQNKTLTNLLGRIILSLESQDINHLEFLDQALDRRRIQKLEKASIHQMLIRSSITCKSSRSICQACYGWDLSTTKLVSLGQAVGIIAAQSIGEPGTQLTMRTFHTGGIFTSELVKQKLAPFSGKLLFPATNLSNRLVSLRTTQGKQVFLVKQQLILVLQNWDGQKMEIPFEIGSFLFFSDSRFVKKGQVLAEFSSQSSFSAGKKVKPIYAPFEGEVKFEKLALKYLSESRPSFGKVNLNDGMLWLTSAKLFSLPNEAKLFFPKIFSKRKAFANLQFVTPCTGTFTYQPEEKTFSFFTATQEFRFSAFYFLPSEKNHFETNFHSEFLPLAKNYQYLDPYTVFAEYAFFPSFQEEIYLIRKKEFLFETSFFIITESDIWKLHFEETTSLGLNFFNDLIEKKEFSPFILKTGNVVAPGKKILSSGFLLKKDGLRFLFQKAFPIRLGYGSIVHCQNQDFVKKHELLATLLTSTQQTEDIVQGLPKIEELIEARTPLHKSFLAERPGVILPESYGGRAYFSFPSSGCSQTSSLVCKPLLTNVRVNEPWFEPHKIKKEIDNPKFSFYCVHSMMTREIILEAKITNELKSSLTNSKNEENEWKSNFWTIVPLPEDYELIFNKSNQTFYFLQKNLEDGGKLRVTSRKKERHWYPFLPKKLNFFRYTPDFQNASFYISMDPGRDAFETSNAEERLLEFFPTEYCYLEAYSPVQKYQVATDRKVLCQPHQFVDLGESLTNGQIDPHDLLSILFVYHCRLDGRIQGCLRSLAKFQLIVINSIQGIYESQGVEIDNRHIEVIVRQMTAKAMIEQSGDTPFLHGEMIPIFFLLELCQSFLSLRKNFSPKFSQLGEAERNEQTEKKGENIQEFYRLPKFEPTFLSSTTSSLLTESFFSAAGFQETKRVLTKAAIEGNIDWLEGLKECIIVGRVIPAGSSFLTYKQNLDHLYKFTKKYRIEKKKAKENPNYLAEHLSEFPFL